LIPANRRSISASGIKPLTFMFNKLDRHSEAQRRPTRNVRARRLEHHTTQPEEGTKMKKLGFATLIASGLTAAVIGFAGPAQAVIGTNHTSTVAQYHSDNHDETNTTNGFVDIPF
jgi:hypothetical protein